MPKIYRLLAEIYSKMGQSSKSIIYYDKFINSHKQYTDTLLAEKNRFFAFQYELQKKDAENKLLLSEKQLKEKIIEANKIEIKNKDTIISLIVIMLVLVVFVVVILIIRAKERNKINSLLKQKNTVAEQKNKILEKENQFKTKLFSIVSHDVRSPLVAIYSLLNLLLSETLKPEKQRELVIQNISKLKKSIAMVDNLLLWTRQQMSANSIKNEKFMVYDLIQSVTSFFFSKINEQNILLQIKCNPDITAWADYNINKIILQNLLSNAIKFTPDNGQIIIRAEEKDDKIIISVSDTGIGIKNEDFNKILEGEDFKSRKGLRDEKGHGLGLKLSKYFALQNNGELWFESEEGKGSVFYFSLNKVR